MSDNKKLSTESYKGVRDFYPEDMAIQNQIFSIWRDTVQKYGYQEYGASILEPADLYRAKSGEEIVNEQTYTFTDRGEREVTLRPEMTPTVARMVAARRRELTFPLRWYSIPNLFRYENPQRGRLREHWQLNVDIFGVTSLQAEIECIQMAHEITKSYGPTETDFEIRINSRKLMDYVSRDVFSLSDEQAHKISKLIDRKNKLPADAFEASAQEILADKTPIFITLLNSKNFEEFVSNLPQTKEEHAGIREVKEVIAGLESLGITNARFDQTLMRGFDYYTGIVFETFDKNPANRRAVLGGGRYDDLLSLFGGDKIPAVGFGAGDVTARDLMETYNRIVSATAVSPADLSLAIIDEKQTGYANDLAQDLRNQGVRVAVDYSGKKISDQIKAADKRGIPYIIIIGETEATSGQLTLKHLATGDEQKVTQDQIAEIVSK
ncbi:MAG: hisS [Candidatus Taylorbacteria bacterium]|nr:hisS [Candidatus Taylorbacteria bacterium]